ncbi:helix-turn-helix domain-containing protein [Pseudonocardia sp.]|uniref:PucR family transcriptional regulator n=1 Tax=Pseudonocardia sp. TaxID=60912 RepID=UPI002609E5E2|nr:helix-turn-helix domain-containing protein [Pseudonocardia sp.]
MPDPPAAMTTLGPALLARLPDVVERIVERVQQGIPLYRNQTYVSTDALRTAAVENVEYLLRTDLPPDGADLAAAHRTGELRGRAGAPLPELLAGFRIGFAVFWEMLADEAIRSPAVTERELAALATHVFWKAHEYSAALTAAHREATADILRRHEQERSALVEALTSGMYGEHGSAWEIANRLGLPASGTFVTVAAEVPAVGTAALPGIASALRAANVSSAWRLLPDIEVGVLALPGPDQSALLRIVGDAAPGRVGISPVHPALEDTPRALYLARIAMQSAPGGSPAVRRFDDAPLATLVVAAPEAATRIARRVLGRVLELRRDEQDALLDTLETWLATGGSAAETGRRMFLHPNTVRHRLRRITEHTGRELQHAVALAELATALHALRLLPGIR